MYLKEPISTIVDGLRPPKTEAAGRQLAAGIASAAMAVRMLPEVRTSLTMQATGMQCTWTSVCAAVFSTMIYTPRKMGERVAI